MMSKLYDLFLRHDCSLIEINPLVVTKDGRLLAADAKLNFDDDAMFRHRDLAQLYDPEQEDPLEAEAGKSASATSDSTAMSAAWSTAPASRWRRWT